MIVGLRIVAVQRGKSYFVCLILMRGKDASNYVRRGEISLKGIFLCHLFHVKTGVVKARQFKAGGQLQQGKPCKPPTRGERGISNSMLSKAKIIKATSTIAACLSRTDAFEPGFGMSATNSITLMG